MAAPGVSIIIPVFNKLPFTKQCLDRVWRHTGAARAYEVIVVDNGSSDGTAEHFAAANRHEHPLRYHRNEVNLGFAKGNNLGAGLAQGRRLLFLNNDTLVQPGWLEAMVAVMEKDPRVGVVGIKQLFPYTNTIHHTGIMFTTGEKPLHLYPYADASLPHVNKQREYQAVNGACLLIDRELFEACGGFDEGYRNGYEDVDLCLAARARGRKVVCCTSAFIYHYGQISEGRTADDPGNAARFAEKWKGRIRVDEGDYFRADAAQLPVPRPRADPSALPDDAVYFADELTGGSALSWATADLAVALKKLGVPVFRAAGPLSRTLDSAVRRKLEPLAVLGPARGGVQVKWSHYWPAHLGLELQGRLNLELFVINYLFGAPGTEPWDYWLQCLPDDHRPKLPLSRFCQEVLLQVGVPEAECHVLPLGYAPEIDAVEPTPRPAGPFRFLTVTNSHDLARYGTLVLLEAYREAFGPRDDVVLVIRDYGGVAEDATLRDRVRAAGPERARVEYRPEFTSKTELIRLYRSCDAFVSAHRAEGFGMKILDALACGLPVVAPLFGGPRDFCTPDNTLPVAHSLAPLGDCLDSRSLRITNRPTWCEPDKGDLVRQLRRLREESGLGQRLGENGRQAVAGRRGWEQSARRLLEIVDTIRPTLPASSAGRSVAAPAPTQVSPYWLGCRVSVVVPTYNRKAILDKCLRALERQTILPEEFEVLVVDDGSTDGTEDYLRAARFAFPLRVFRQPNQGPGAARNLAIREARGELVLFIGDDIIADDRLLESHLLGHARHPEPGDAILGHIDWAPWLESNAVMQYVGGDGRQFAYDFIPTLPSLDFRFFYTSNLSLKRRFLLDAFEDGIRFDPCFRYAAFEDSEFAYRLMPRGLELRYRADAKVVHDHQMDLASFSRREYHVGQMAVVFYRKHPGLDHLLDVRWIGDWVDDVERVLAQPALLERLRAIDTLTDELLASLARSTEELRRLDAGLGGALPSLLALIFDVSRLRGKVDEWYRAVKDPAHAEAARTLLASLRKLEYLSAGLSDPRAAALQEEAAGLRQQFGNRHVGPKPPPVPGPLRRLLRRIAFGRGVFPLLRSADLYLQARLGAQEQRGWPARYRRLRSRLRRLL
jgi:GT2 family glycosyltransferase/glycosyltransferase involved in cell wall biosynthesis